MSAQQSIPNPFGITTFGSALLRVEPDIASLKFSVSRLEQQPQEAFQQAREGAKAVSVYLSQGNIKDFGSSRINLSQKFRYSGGENHFVGYSAQIAFHVLLHDLDRMEEVLIGVIKAGANEINSVEFQTSRLKELRAEVRQRAVAAAHEKAQIYSEAAGVALGPVTHIEDVNPDQLRGQEGHQLQKAQPDDEGELLAINPGSISVGGAVLIAFELNKLGNSNR